MNQRQNQPNNSGTAQRSKKNKQKIYGLVGGAALALAVTFGGNALIPAINTASAQTTTPAASTTASPTNPGTGATQAQQPPFANMRDQGGRGGKGDMGQRNGASGTISAISGNTLTLKQGDVVVVQATLNASTVYTKAGQTIALSDLKVGQKASVRTTTDSSGTVSVSAVEIILDRAGGSISAIDASSMTITKSDNTTVKVSLSSATSYQDLGKATTLASLKVGMKVDVAGMKNADGTLSAEVINVQHDHLGGAITAINGNTLTVQADGRGGPGDGMGRGPGGMPGGPNNANPRNGNGNANPPASTAATKTITVESSTVYLEGGQTVQLSNLVVGDRINAAGTLSSDGNSLSALQIMVQLPHYQGQVSSVTGSTIVIQERNTSRTIEVNSSTKYLNGQASASLSDVKVGTNLSAEGKVDANGKMTASVVQLGQGQRSGPGH